MSAIDCRFFDSEVLQTLRLQHSAPGFRHACEGISGVSARREAKVLTRFLPKCGNSARCLPQLTHLCSAFTLEGDWRCWTRMCFFAIEIHAMMRPKAMATMHQTMSCHCADPWTPEGQAMTDTLRVARAAWPDVQLAPELFVAHLRTHAPEGASPELAMREMRTNDLYLACACARGDQRAIDWFERRCLSVIEETLPRMAGMDPHTVDDVKQRLRHRLLVFDDRPPQILDFSGRGSLRSWLRTLAVREALALTHRSRRESLSNTELLETALASAADPEREYFKRVYQSEFANAITEAMLNLRPEERTLLKQSIVDGLNLDHISRLHHVHRATAARWLARARQALSRRTLAILTRRLRVEPVELHNILHIVRSGLHMSLRLLFPRAGRQRH